MPSWVWWLLRLIAADYGAHTAYELLHRAEQASKDGGADLPQEAMDFTPDISDFDFEDHGYIWDRPCTEDD